MRIESDRAHLYRVRALLSGAIALSVPLACAGTRSSSISAEMACSRTQLPQRDNCRSVLAEREPDRAIWRGSLLRIKPAAPKADNLFVGIGT
jgi:hypothetical protein